MERLWPNNNGKSGQANSPRHRSLQIKPRRRRDGRQRVEPAGKDDCPRTLQHIDEEHCQRRPLPHDAQYVRRTDGFGAMLPDIDALKQFRRQIARGNRTEQIGDRQPRRTRYPEDDRNSPRRSSFGESSVRRPLPYRKPLSIRAALALSKCNVITFRIRAPMRPPMKALLLAVLAAAGIALPAAAAPISIVAAENFYGEAAAAIGGDRVAVDQHPHQRQAPTRTTSSRRPRSPASSPTRAIVVHERRRLRPVDGPPLDRRDASPTARSSTSRALSARKAGDNPHLWYDPRRCRRSPKRWPPTLGAADPATRPAIERGAGFPCVAGADHREDRGDAARNLPARR